MRISDRMKRQAVVISALLVVGVFGLTAGWFLSSQRYYQNTRPGKDEVNDSESAMSGVEYEENKEIAAIQGSLRAIELILATLEQSDNDASGKSESPAENSDESLSAAMALICDKLDALEGTLAELQALIKDQGVVQAMPTAFQMRAMGGATNTDEVKRFCNLLNDDQQAAREIVLGSSHDDILARFGMPTTIEVDEWFYSGGPGSGCVFLLRFVNGIVGSVRK